MSLAANFVKLPDQAEKQVLTKDSDGEVQRCSPDIRAKTCLPSASGNALGVPIWVIRTHVCNQFKLLANKPRHRICIFGDGTPQFGVG
jgi:hypothetical protein